MSQHGGWGYGGYGPPPAPGGYGPPPSHGHFHGHAAMVPTAGGGLAPSCRLCGAPTALHSKISTAGWVVFFGLLIFCFPLCWAGLLMREHGQRCTRCMAMQGAMG
jgi:hypothetical protein